MLVFLQCTLHSTHFTLYNRGRIAFIAFIPSILIVWHTLIKIKLTEQQTFRIEIEEITFQFKISHSNSIVWSNLIAQSICGKFPSLRTNSQANVCVYCLFWFLRQLICLICCQFLFRVNCCLFMAIMHSLSTRKLKKKQTNIEFWSIWINWHCLLIDFRFFLYLIVQLSVYLFVIFPCCCFGYFEADSTKSKQ